MDVTERIGEYMVAQYTGPSASGKTKNWRIESRRGDVLGEVRWFSRWRCYAFMPQPGTVFNAGCMSELVSFCERKMEEHKS